MHIRRAFSIPFLAAAFLSGVALFVDLPLAFGQCTAACLNRVETFTQQQTFGTGTFSSTNSFGGGTATAFILGLLGSTGSPNTNTGAGFIFENIQNTNSSQVNSVSGAFLEKKLGSGTNSRGTALYAEIEDDGGGASPTNFAEGSRSVCTGNVSTVSCYGSIHLTQTNSGINHVYLIADETQIFDNGTIPPGSTFNRNTATIGYNAGCGGAQNCDTGFLTNPFDVKTFREGFLVGENSVSDAAFRSRAATNYGLDLSQGSQSIASVLSPNMTALKAMNATNTASLREMYINTYNQVVVGDDPGLRNINLGTTGVPVYIAQYYSSTSSNICVNGGYVAACTSLRKFKKDIAPLDSGLKELSILNPVAYTSKTSGRREIGFIAEDVNKIDPRLSTYDKDGLVGIQYDHLTALLVKAIQEQQSEIESLREEIKSLKDRH
jgi:hypothetical protein